MSTTHAPTRRFSNIVNAGEADSRRWLVLASICFAALMIVLDVTVMNLALPSAQRTLGFTNADRQWIVTAYSLSFGSLLLFGPSRPPACPVPASTPRRCSPSIPQVPRSDRG